MHTYIPTMRTHPTVRLLRLICNRTIHAITHNLPQFDFYRKIPLDLTEATWHGGLVSVLAL